MASDDGQRAGSSSACLVAVMACIAHVARAATRARRGSRATYLCEAAGSTVPRPAQRCRQSGRQCAAVKYGACHGSREARERARALIVVICAVDTGPRTRAMEACSWSASCQMQPRRAYRSVDGRCGAASMAQLFLAVSWSASPKRPSALAPLSLLVVAGHSFSQTYARLNIVLPPHLPLHLFSTHLPSPRSSTESWF